MAVRKRLYHPDEVRQKIQASVLLDLLKKHATGAQTIDRSRVEAINILLKKVMPDLSAIEMTQREELPAEGTILDRLKGILAAHPDLRLAFWELLCRDMATADMTTQEMERRQAALLQAHPDFKRQLVKALQADLPALEAAIA